MFKKILISAPTASAKYYCFEDWIDNVMMLNYPDYEVRLFDNTMDDGESANKQNQYFQSKYGKNNTQFSAIKSATNSDMGLIERMCISTNECREYALNNDFTHLLMLESDIFPPSNVIEELLYHKKKVIGAIYYLDGGSNRRIMLQQLVFRSGTDVVSDNATSRHDAIFCDGTIKTASHIGLGCILISREVLKKIKFRYEKWELTQGVGLHPDVYFAQDCHRSGYKIWAHTGLICEHRNKSWDLEVYRKGLKI